MKNQAFLLWFAQEDRDTIAYRGTSQEYLMVMVVITIMVLNDTDLEILLFVNKYKYVKASDFKYLYNNTQYYQSKVKQLIRDEYLRKMKWYLVLGRKGKLYLENLGYKCTRISYEKVYVERQKIISSFAARYYNNKYINFLPSIDIKDKQAYTITSRKYIGILEIDKAKYLTYYISKKHTYKYIQSIIYDIRKERKFKNVIVFTEDIDVIDINQFVFGLDEILIIPPTEDNLYILENINKINYQSIFANTYKNKVYLSEYDFCNYYTEHESFISVLPFIDSEKLCGLKYFLLENKYKTVDILYSKNIPLTAIGKIKGANYKTINFNKYIKKEFNIYD